MSTGLGNGGWCAACGAPGVMRCPVCTARWCRACPIKIFVRTPMLEIGFRCRTCGHEWALPGAPSTDEA